MNLSDVYAKVRPACVGIAMEVQVGEEARFIAFGSGACVDSSGVIVTAKHVVTSFYEWKTGTPTPDYIETLPDFFVIFTRRQSNKFDLIYAKPNAIMLSQEDDVAIMKIPEVPDGWPAFVFPSSWNTREGDHVATAGYPLREFSDSNALPQLFSGIISQIDSEYVNTNNRSGWLIKHVIMDMSIHPGNSGGPIFDAPTGKLIGLVESQKLRAADLSRAAETAKNPDLEDHTLNNERIHVWTNISFGVPWTAFKPGVEQLLKSLKPSKL